MYFVQYELIVFENDTLLSIIEYINILLFACTLLEADSCRLYFLLQKESDQSNNPCLNHYAVLVTSLAVRLKKKNKLCSLKVTVNEDICG